MYKIEILTPAGLKTVNFDPNTQSLEKFEKDLINKYGQFVTIKSEKVS